jgi:hypothetical protein
MGRGAGGELGALDMPNPYSRAECTELQLQFRPPRDGPTVSTRLRDYATAEEIAVVVAALQLPRRELSVRVRGANRTVTRRMSAAAQDAALAAMWAAADGRRIGWILGYLRKCIVHRDYRDYAGLLPSGRSAAAVLCPVSRRRPRSKIYVKRGSRLQSMMMLLGSHLRWMAERDIRRCCEWLLPHEKRLSPSKQYRLISDLEAARRKAQEAGGLRQLRNGV